MLKTEAGEDDEDDEVDDDDGDWKLHFWFFFLESNWVVVLFLENHEIF